MASEIYQTVKRRPDLVKSVIDFFLAVKINPDMYNNIKRVCGSRAINNNQLEEANLIELGHFSSQDCAWYLLEENVIRGVETETIEYVVNSLVENYIIKPSMLTLYGVINKRFYCIKHAKFFYERDIILNLLSGWQYIVDKFKKSVFIIENTDANGDVSNGTGFYVAVNDSGTLRNYTVTNKHVLENASKVTVFDSVCNEIE